MHIGTLTQMGNSVALVVPKQYMRELRWFRGDKVVLAVESEGLRVTALEDHLVRLAQRKGLGRRGRDGEDTAS